ncbi:hypothetical protein JVT61DRAFT_1625 [Boletus reticuloceps]|uniref:Uncharacterized protein n=1 Tax=Boletus reticuloceps TaxID=495285 RepID=A0A8I3ABU3_9AGAM|nr:hypothetical protein JVT61DRAFT_1625 [Boletus reticuloceps]
MAPQAVVEFLHWAHLHRSPLFNGQLNSVYILSFDMSVLVPAQFPSLSAVFMVVAASILLLFVAHILSVSGPVQWFVPNPSRKKSRGAIRHPSPTPGVVLCSGTSSLYSSHSP